MDKVLMHTCCAPCSVACIEKLRYEKIEPISFWFNPNIHPFTEYQSRLETLENYAPSINMKLIVKEDYGLREFCKNVVDDIEGRCQYCYQTRLEETAKFAKENGYEFFTTTLLISPYQKHEVIANLGERIGDEIGVKFLYRDFRPYFKEGQEKARELGFYMQKYCGCVFSEEDRYALKIAKKMANPLKEF